MATPAPTRAWTPTKPANSDDPRIGDDEIRWLKEAIHQRTNNGGMIWATTDEATAGSTQGRLACGVQDTNVLYLYETDGTTPAVTINDGATQSVTLGDGTTGSNRYNLTIGGTLAQLGARRVKITVSSATAYTASATDHYIVMTANAAATVTLPAATDNPYRVFVIARGANAGTANTLTVLPAATTTTIEGAASYVVSAGTFNGAARFLCDGTSVWYVVGKRATA